MMYFYIKYQIQRKKNNFCKTKYDVVVRKSTGILYKDSDNSTREILRSESWGIFFDFFNQKKVFAGGFFKICIY